MTKQFSELSVDTQSVTLAMALRWTWTTQTMTVGLCAQLGLRAETKAINSAMVQEAWRELEDDGLLLRHVNRNGYVRLNNALRNEAFKAVLDRFSANKLRTALHNAEGVRSNDLIGYFLPTYEPMTSIALFHLAAFIDTPEALARMRQGLERMQHLDTVYREGFEEGFDAELFGALAPSVRWEIAYHAVQAVCLDWKLADLGMADWAAAQSIESIPADHHWVFTQLAEWMVHRGEAERAQAYLAGLDGGTVHALNAALATQRGEWEAAQAGFELALKERHLETGSRKRLLPVSLLWYYPLCLLAQGKLKALQSARKICTAEAGTKSPSPFDAWGQWLHVINARLGDGAFDPAVLSYAGEHTREGWSALWKILLRAWMADEMAGAADEDRMLAAGEQLSLTLMSLRMHWLAEQVDKATSLAEGDAVSDFFVGCSGEKWRNVLAALTALGEDNTVAGAVSDVATRLVWVVELATDGRVESIEPMEQKRGLRGWSKTKPVPMSRLVGNAKLAPHDAKVAQAIRVDRYNKRNISIDRAAAMLALVGHPAVSVYSDPETFLDVVAGTPEVEVVREEGGFAVRVSPDPATPDPRAPKWFADQNAEREYEARRSTIVLRESAQRLRVVSFTPAQRRAAQLLAEGFRVPDSAQDELGSALRALSTHFSVHADHSTAAREVAGETRLRAELSPLDEGLLLRLVAAPLGVDGPRLMPGQGREMVSASIKGESLGARRDLAAETANLNAVLDVAPFLPPPSRGDVICEWPVPEPELALGLVESLPTLPALSGIDWPRGKPMRVSRIDLGQLQLQVTGKRDWFNLSGQASLDEGRVFALEQLIEAASGRSRFIALGEGQYLALSHALRERLNAIAAVAEAQKDGEGIRIPTIASAWLDDALADMDFDADEKFIDRIAAWERSLAQRPALPASLQAELRPYQEDGYQWAMQLAAAGFGAVLADDMGLGKTVQAIAVLLARAAGGPALVVAPTSLSGNWKAELERFAPSLDVAIYGEGEREGLIESIQAGGVLIVSYTLMQQAGEAFAAREWHTLIADEAQAVKNAAAKRSQALFDLSADFRMALSGTPVENRLAELWSVMRFCNPGLLGSLNRFNDRFAGPIERDRDREAQHMLRRLIAPFVLRRTKGQVLQELPPRTELTLAVTPEADEAAHYEALRRRAITDAEKSAATEGGNARFNILAQLTRLRRAACDPRLVSHELGIVGAKVRAFAELAAELAANGHKTLVFSQFVDFLTLLREPLDAAGLSYQYLDGATPPAERTRRVADFQAGAGDFFLISLKAGGYGLNLTAADYVIITDPWWNPAAEDQAMGRAHRMGQLRPVTVYRLVNKGTLEERIVDLHHDKRALAEGVLGESGETVALPSTNELIALMRG